MAADVTKRWTVLYTAKFRALGGALLVRHGRAERIYTISSQQHQVAWHACNRDRLAIHSRPVVQKWLPCNILGFLESRALKMLLSLSPIIHQERGHFQSNWYIMPATCLALLWRLHWWLHRRLRLKIHCSLDLAWKFVTIHLPTCYWSKGRTGPPPDFFVIIVASRILTFTKNAGHIA